VELIGTGLYLSLFGTFDLKSPLVLLLFTFAPRLVLYAQPVFTVYLVHLTYLGPGPWTLRLIFLLSPSHSLSFLCIISLLHTISCVHQVFTLILITRLKKNFFSIILEELHIVY
jgi:hypothetical protein